MYGVDNAHFSQSTEHLMYKDTKKLLTYSLNSYSAFANDLVAIEITSVVKKCTKKPQLSKSKDI